MASVSQYLDRVAGKLKGGNATEHSYRSALEFLFESAAEDVSALNEPKRVACGAPDFIISQKSIAVGHCEAKDLIIDLSDLKGANVDQKQRYLKALPNLCYTNSLDFEFYRNGSLLRTVSVGERVGNAIKRSPKNFADLSAQLADFVAQRPQTITSSRSLAILMAGKATLIKDILFKAMADDEDGESELNAQYRAFKTHLIEDIQPEEFADIYAETISYGMFAARLHDTSSTTFSRQEALELLPKSNPFLRSLFGYIAGADLDDRIRWVLDDLADVFQACDVHSLMHDFGTLTQQNDPFLHFYETFLAAYNPKKRRVRGVWYTPEPIVNFIVRAVDDRLIEDFGLPMGLADSSKVAIKWDHGQKGKLRKEVHRVQILDPATGTGTFLAETIKQISVRVKGIAPGLWSKYIEDDLIPRIHGFELLMASYAMCHMKLDMVLTELGYVPIKQNSRLGVYLTNSLEEGHIVSQDLFAQWFTNEAKLASAIKRDMPIMCVIGNPPYSKASTNKGTFITGLVADYKKGLGETSLNSLSDDYVKFIRYAEHHIERSGQGIVAMITNNSFLDGVVHRQMRKRLMSTFDDIYIYNLHGDSNKNEVSPNGGVDKNVFDIRQGVSVAIMVRREQKTKQPAKVRYLSSYGSRSAKYRDLWDGRVADMDFAVLKPDAPYFFFKDKDLANREVYEKGFKLSDLFIEYGSGIKFRKDNLLIRPHFNKDSVRRMVQHMQKSTEAKILETYSFNETDDWTIEAQRANFEDFQEVDVRRVLYRPFDFRFTYYPLHRISAIIPRGDSRKGLMHNMNSGKNLALLVGRQNKSGAVDHFLVTDAMSEMKTGERTIQSYHMPLYIEPLPGALVTERRSNLNTKIVTRIRKLADPKGLKPPSDVDLFDYIYGVLYSPSYRATYSEFLKIDFPHIPYPTSTEEFWNVVGHGSALRRLHLMEEKAIGATNTPFVGAGDGTVATPTFKPSKRGWGKIMINSTQAFENVAETTWKLQIGGYQPADRWLKEREGLALSLVDVMQYQKVLKILAETNRLVAGMEAGPTPSTA